MTEDASATRLISTTSVLFGNPRVEDGTKSAAGSPGGRSDPWRGMSVADAIRMIQGGELHSSVLEPNLPRTLRDIIERATQRSPEDRYAHARVMAFDLRREMLRLGLCDAQTCVRHAIVGWCEGGGRSSSAMQAQPQPNDARERPEKTRSSTPALRLPPRDADRIVSLDHARLLRDRGQELNRTGDVDRSCA
jgi:hypothetical protein